MLLLRKIESMPKARVAVLGALRDKVFRPFRELLLEWTDDSRGMSDNLEQHAYDLATGTFRQRHPNYEPDDSALLESGAPFGVTPASLSDLSQNGRAGLRWRAIRDSIVRDVAANPQSYSPSCRLLGRRDATYDWGLLAAADNDCHPELLPLHKSVMDWANALHMRPVAPFDEWFPSIGFSTVLHWGNSRIWGFLGPNLSDDYLRIGGEAGQFSYQVPDPKYPTVHAKAPPPEPPDKLLEAGWPRYRPHSHLRRFHEQQSNKWIDAKVTDGLGSPDIARLHDASVELSEREARERRRRFPDKRIMREARARTKATDAICDYYRELDKEYCDELDRWFEDSGCTPVYRTSFDLDLPRWALEWVVRFQMLGESGETIALDGVDRGTPRYPRRRRRTKPEKDRGTPEQIASDAASASVSHVTVYKVVERHLGLLGVERRDKGQPKQLSEQAICPDRELELKYDDRVRIVDTLQTKSPVDCPACGAPAYKQRVEVFCPSDGSRQVTFDFHRDFTDGQYHSMLADLRAFLERLQQVKMKIREAEPVSVGDDAAQSLTDFDFDMPDANPEQRWGRATPTATLVTGSLQTCLTGDEIVLADETSEAIIDAMLKTARTSLHPFLTDDQTG
jgi:hypothetical protein